MNENQARNIFNPTSQAAIDQMVDGELDDVQQRELLAGLDEVEGGWRRLALTYVESQCLRNDLTAIASEPNPVVLPSATRCVPVSAVPAWTAASVVRDRRASRWLPTLLAMAASFLVAFGLGHWFRSAEPNGQRVVAAPQLVTTVNAPAANVVESPPHPVAQQLAVPTGKVDSTTPGIDSIGSTQAVSLSTKSEPVGISLIPAGSGASLDDESSLMPPRVVEALQRLGHRVQQRRQLLPLSLPDGRKIELPVEQIDVQYRGEPAFQ